MSSPIPPLIAGRFRPIREAGSGAMGVVYCADDLRAGGRVALKILNAREALPTRFFHEASVLSELRHPAVVRLVAQGSTETGRPFVAMEWLEGETLDARIARGPLDPADVTALAARVLGALAAAHERGIVHRDLKPANLFLVGGDVRETKLLDFGIATRVSTTLEKGRAVGTPFYMAPEQARGVTELDGRADLFALGSVLYEALTGKPAFHAQNVMGVLATICLAEPRPLRELRPDVPPVLERLVRKLLQKRPADRGDASGLAVELDREIAAPPTMASGHGLSGEERRVVCVLAATRALQSPEQALTPALEERVLQFGGEPNVLVDGSLVVTFREDASPAGQATRAARCALMLRTAEPEITCAIGTGCAVMLGGLPLGEVIDQTVTRLQRGATRAIFVDDNTAALLGAKFDLAQRDGELVLGTEVERTPMPAARPEGQAPFVGRDREIAHLLSTFDDVAARRTSRAVVVVGSPGRGKSRLRAELLETMARQGRRAFVLFADADPMRVGVPYGAMGSALAATMGLGLRLEGQARRDALLRWVRERMPDEEAARVAAYLGELVGAPFPDEADPLLVSARQDPRVKAEQIQHAFLDLLRVEGERQPIVMVLEDLQWFDGPSVGLVDVALRDGVGLPLFVLSLARPDVDEAHPQLWQGRQVDRLALGALPDNAARQIARHLLGAEHAQTADWIVGRVDGNPFFIEETARALRRRRKTELPEAVLGTVQSRLDDLPAPARKVLRAASVFGQRFSRAEVEALLPADDRDELTSWLASLAQEELIARVGLRAEERWTFRHQLIQQAAYESLTEGDRIFAHRAAGRFLEATASAPPTVLVEHFERGGDRPRAAEWCVAAAESALAGYDLDGAIALARRGVALGAPAEREGMLELMQAKALLWKGDGVEGERAASKAQSRMTPGTSSWFEAANTRGCSCYLAGNVPLLCVVGEQVAVTSAVDAAAAERRVLALAMIASPLIYARVEDEGRRLLKIAEAWSAAELSPVVRARLAMARFAAHALIDRRRDLALAAGWDALAQAAASGDELVHAELANNLGSQLYEVGCYEEAERMQKGCIAVAEKARSRYLEGFACANLAQIRTVLGRSDEADVDLARARAALVGVDEARTATALALYASRLRQQQGDWQAALAEAERAAAPEAAPGFRVPALANLALVELAIGETERAHTHAEESNRLLASGVTAEEDEFLPLLALALTSQARDDRRAAADALRRARAGVLESAGRLADESLRSSYLRRVPTHARIMQLAAEWGLDDETEPGIRAAE